VDADRCPLKIKLTLGRRLSVRGLPPLFTGIAVKLLSAGLSWAVGPIEVVGDRPPATSLAAKGFQSFD
jgi:hypothetical protein